MRGILADPIVSGLAAVCVLVILSLWLSGFLAKRRERRYELERQRLRKEFLAREGDQPS